MLQVYPCKSTFSFDITEMLIAFKTGHVDSSLTFFGARHQCVGEDLTTKYGKEVLQFAELFTTSRLPEWTLLILRETDSLFSVEWSFP